MFDELKIDILDYTIEAKADQRKVELIEAAGLILTKVFYAEFLVTLDKSFVHAHAGCGGCGPFGQATGSLWPITFSRNSSTRPRCNCS